MLLSARDHLRAQDAARVSKDIDAPIRKGEFLDDVSDVAIEKLFKAMILQTFKDACSELPDALPIRMPKGWAPPAKSKKSRRDAWDTFWQGREARRREVERDRDAARDWLLNGGRDFDLLCNSANWEPGYIRRGANKLAALGWPQKAAMLELLAA